jgi:CDP-diacylglycerol--glycerol-3-phosphate 3-phosphatidyltransferase
MSPVYLLPSWSTLFVTAVAFAIVSAYGVRTALVGRVREERVERVGGSVFLGRWFLEAFYWSFRLAGKALIWAGVSPDALTWSAVGVTGLGAFFAAAGHFSTAGALVLLGAVLDALDGLVARERGLASERGEVLDAVVDRYSDILPLAALAIFYRDSAAAMLAPLGALMGSVLVSYVRAKSEALGLDLPSGLMRRHERLTYLVVALVIGPELSRWLGAPYGMTHPATLLLVGVVALVSNVAALQLLFAARRALLGPHQRRGGRR